MKTRLFVLIMVGFCWLPDTNGQALFRVHQNQTADERLKQFWQYCADNLISDKDSVTTCRWLLDIEKTADSLHDEQLKKYAAYFRICFRVLFSKNYEQYFARGDYESVANVYRRGQTWARQNGHTDIDAVCEHYVGEVYYYAAQYGPAFEYLLRANDLFRKIGYEKIPAISTYLYDLGLNYYKFEEWDKALHYFLQASHYPFYADWIELSTFNAIALIYNKKKDWKKAKWYFHYTLDKAVRYHNQAWVGIVLDNLGESFAEEGEKDSALLYYVRSFHINEVSAAPETGAFTALSIAWLQIEKQLPDSAQWYIRRGKELAAVSVMDSVTQLRFRAELLKVLITLHKQQGTYQTALLYADSLGEVQYQLYQILDDKIINQVESKRHIAEINLLEAEQRLSRFRFYALLTTILLTGVLVVFLFSRYRLRKRRQIADASREKERIAAEKQRVDEQLQQAEQSLAAYLHTIKEKTDLIENLGSEIQQLQESSKTPTDLQGLTTNMEKLVSTTILTEEGWNYFKGLFEQVHPGFVQRLRAKYPDLSPAETRMLILSKLNLSSRETANMLGITTDSLRKARYRLRKRLNMEEENSIELLVERI